MLGSRRQLLILATNRRGAPRSAQRTGPPHALGRRLPLEGTTPPGGSSASSAAAPSSVAKPKDPGSLQLRVDVVHAFTGADTPARWNLYPLPLDASGRPASMAQEIERATPQKRRDWETRDGRLAQGVPSFGLAAQGRTQGPVDGSSRGAGGRPQGPRALGSPRVVARRRGRRRPGARSRHARGADGAAGGRRCSRRGVPWLARTAASARFASST